MSSRKLSGRPIDAAYQHISEAPAYQNDSETIYVNEPEGEETVENVTIPGERPDVEEGHLPGSNPE